ncbi:hypothetical protein PVAG01_02238 [Phlyctema vagabunda]|uniref:Heme haloperoxidase family profile domain-containing protein n=1 Tax=Phlyctema vagabunda TaxID=108571 RepID=A0ABR4PQ16_9HELO
MKLTTLYTTAAAFTIASATPYLANTTVGSWIPGGSDDFRGPCPMMNTLANHGFLPRDGRNITLENAVFALTTALNFNQSLATIMFNAAVHVNPEPNATFFTLDHLNQHNVLEHDASLSRADAFDGNNHVFNQTVFDESRSYWVGDVLNIDMFVNSKLARQITSRAFNPNYTFTATTEQFSLGEVGAPITVFGDFASATVKRDLVEYFFENERLPTELGWTKKEAQVNVEDVLRISQLLTNSSTLLTGGEAAHAETRRDFHGGRF